MEPPQILAFTPEVERPISVVCLKWGDPYPAEYVNVLQRAVRENLSYAHNFVCITDSSEGLAPEVEVKELPELPLERKDWLPGYWPKLSIFKKGMFSEEAIVIYLDVDVLINQSLDPFIDLLAQERGLRIIREWNPDIWKLFPVGLRPDRGGNGSMIGFVASEQTHLFHEFVACPDYAISNYGIDQQYITFEGHNRRYWPDRWCDSFRRSCVPHWPLNFFFRKIRRPTQSKVIVFHGTPNPTDLVENGEYRWGRTWRYGNGPVKWVQEYWEKYSKAA